MKNSYKVIVIGGGHAGVEAACAAARLGQPTALISLRRAGIGQMSCNPAIGGLGKGHIVKEVDALGGVMGRVTDLTGIQFRTLNSSKGPAVRASRAQCDRDLYKGAVLKAVEAQPNLSVVEAEVSAIEARAGKVSAVRLADGVALSCESVVVTTGTFLRALMHTGAEQQSGGRQGDLASNALSDSLRTLGFELGRLKTGTPPRLRRSTIDFNSLQEQPGEYPAKPFSIMTDAITQPQISCWITSTAEDVHDIIRANRERSPMFNGQIQSRGPRYCPSIEDKVYRFADKTSHNIFLEPEGHDSDIVYPNGISTSLPVDVQEEFVRKIKGLKNVQFLQYGYAVEYDFIDPRNLKPTLETKLIEGLFLAGQINGTSGYEEAAGQGLVAGANAALRVSGSEPLIISRGQGYIGVMIDDLINNGVDEPYRMFTSRAEYRLVLREDNAASRLTPLARKLGLITDTQWQRFESRDQDLQKALHWSENFRIKPTPDTNVWLSAQGSAELKDSITLAVLARRPELRMEDLLVRYPFEKSLAPDIVAALETEIKFKGYLTRQDDEIARMKKIEEVRIPDDFSYDELHSLRIEAREKLKRLRPYSVGQAMRIPGITPSAISLIAIELKRQGVI